MASIQSYLISFLFRRLHLFESDQMDLAELRILASRLGVKSIIASGMDLVFSFTKESDVKADALFAKAKGEVRIAGPKTVYLRLSQNYFEPKTLINVLRKILSNG